MKLTEAVDRYYENKNEIALYNNIARSHCILNEMEEVLKDTLGSNYNEDILLNAVAEYMQEVTSRIPSIEGSDKDFE